MKKKSVALVLALALVVVCIVGGTLAWLTATTPAVTNTFTTSDISITLTETKGGTNHDEFKMIPGWTIEKDPKVTVQNRSEKCYLFVKLVKSDNFDDFMTYELASGWTQLQQLQDKNIVDVPGVYYRIVDITDMGTAYSVLKDDQVSVKDTVTKSMMNGLTTNPTLTVTAYATQYMKNNTEHFEPYDAWGKVKQ